MGVNPVVKATRIGRLAASHRVAAKGEQKLDLPPPHHQLVPQAAKPQRDAGEGITENHAE